MFRRFAVLGRCPLAPPALPGVDATMGTSDFHTPMLAPLEAAGGVGGGSVF